MKTNKLALERSIRLWTWMAEANNRYKGKWPGWKRFKNRPRHYCFLCELHYNQYEECPDCPVDWGGKPGMGEVVRCCKDGSPFLLWTMKRDMKSAASVRDLLIKTLAEL